MFITSRLPPAFAGLATVAVFCGVTGLFMDSPQERLEAFVVAVPLALIAAVVSRIDVGVRRRDRRAFRQRILASLRELRPERDRWRNERRQAKRAQDAD